jgi:hypothetical protein
MMKGEYALGTLCEPFKWLKSQSWALHAIYRVRNPGKLIARRGGSCTAMRCPEAMIGTHLASYSPLHCQIY